ncbi:hypothetical protein M8818_007111 [Zalaria obscura]|uniref:Uncharacterized protein n=1 Tax=Zalaria obscura TaxID=2024903 RepID=A0ACC3S415_9PEZI
MFAQPCVSGSLHRLGGRDSASTLCFKLPLPSAMTECGLVLFRDFAISPMTVCDGPSGCLTCGIAAPSTSGPGMAQTFVGTCMWLTFVWTAALVVGPASLNREMFP